VIAVLDASAAIKIIFQQTSIKSLSEYLKRADWVIAPDIFVSEVTNTFWKYHQFEDLPLDICETSMNKTIALVDDFIQTEELYREAFSFSCQVNHPVYDSMYLICARRHNAIFISVDKKLTKLAQKHSIKIVDAI
jgi:predicted nucleic acid-binding protein